MYIDFDGHHSSGSFFGICIRYFDYVIRFGPYPQVQFDFKKKKKKSGSGVPVMVSRPELGSDRDSGRDKLVSEPRFRRFWISLRLRMYLHSNVLA